MQDTIKDLKEQMQGISLVAYEASEESIIALEEIINKALEEINS